MISINDDHLHDALRKSPHDDHHRNDPRNDDLLRDENSPRDEFAVHSVRVVNLGTQLPKDKGIPGEGTTEGSDKAVVREGNCLGGTGLGNPEGLDTVEGNKAAAGDRARLVDSLVGGTVQGSLLVVVGLRRNQILRCLIVIKDITIGILEESNIASQLQRWVEWVAEVKKLRVLEEGGGGCGEPHFLSVHELVRHLQRGLVEAAEFQ